MSGKTVVVVGAGVMGISAALAAKRRHPEYTVYLINDSRPSVKPASEDTAKIIRDAYSDNGYAKLAAEAINSWKAEPIYEDYWHQSGWIVIRLSAEDQSIPSGPQSMTKACFLERFPGTNLNKVHSISEDRKPAWVEASRALEATVNMAKSEGVVFKDCRVTNLLWDGSKCIGVALSDGFEIAADLVLLSMGHHTTVFLEQRNLPCEEGQRVGVPVLGVQLNDWQYEKYKNMPILVASGRGEILPPDRNKIIKINNSRSFRVPDLSLIEPESSLTLNSPYFEENRNLLTWLLPDLKEAPVVFCRYCLDFITKTQDFHIHPVKKHQGLYVAHGGSFHGWKFLPNIGRYIAQMMDGDDTFHNTWSRWAGSGGSDQKLIHSAVIPTRTFPEGQIHIERQ